MASEMETSSRRHTFRSRHIRVPSRDVIHAHGGTRISGSVLRDVRPSVFQGKRPGMNVIQRNMWTTCYSVFVAIIMLALFVLGL